MDKKIRFVFFGSSTFSKFVLEELEKKKFFPILNVTSTRENLDPRKLREVDADFFVVASFGKILPKELLGIPKHGSLNVHPSLLPEMRGPSPIQNLILQDAAPAVTIIKMDEQMDHGPILAQEKVLIEPWPDHYMIVEEKLAHAGGKLLVKTLENVPEPIPQDESRTTYCKLVKKENGLLDLNDDAETNYRKVLAYSTWPGAYMFFRSKTGREIRVVVNDAKVENGEFLPTRVTPAGKREMDWESFLRGNA